MENTMNKKTEITAEEFKKIAREVFPHLLAIRDAMKKYYGADQGASISVNTDGYVSFSPHDTPWRLVHYSSEEGRKASIHYEYSECLYPMEGEGE